MGSQGATAVVDLELLAERIVQVRERIARAARRARRDPAEVTLVAVTKGFPVEVVRGAADCGLTVFGENRVQEARAKIPLVDREGLSWHLVGPLQRNKVKYCFDLFDLIHSVDSVALVAEIERRAAARDAVMDVLLEVNVAGEAAKHGVAPEEALGLAEAVGRLERVRLRGLMAMPPMVTDPEANRGHFRTLRLLQDAIARAGIEGVAMDHLSMGMSDDFEVAIEEGATVVRIGTALFGPREVHR
ncbi:MAG: YggS family pyridoxal phosphate-dependent enzyme [Nitrospinota bacterium]